MGLRGYQTGTPSPENFQKMQYSDPLETFYITLHRIFGETPQTLNFFNPCATSSQYQRTNICSFRANNFKPRVLKQNRQTWTIKIMKKFEVLIIKIRVKLGIPNFISIFVRRKSYQEKQNRNMKVNQS